MPSATIAASSREATAGPDHGLASPEGWLRDQLLSASPEVESHGSRGEQGSGGSAGLNPYFGFFEEFGDRLDGLPMVRGSDPEPMTSAECIARCSGESALVLLMAEREELPSVLPSVCLQVRLPTGEKLRIPQVTSLEVRQGRPRILPVNQHFGGVHLLYSTAMPLAFLRLGESGYLVGVGEEGERVEYAFAGQGTAAVEIPPTVRVFDVKGYGKIAVMTADGHGGLAVQTENGARTLVKTVSFSEAEKAAVWRTGDGELLVISDLDLVESHHDGVSVRLPPGGASRLRMFPGGLVRAVECEGATYEVQHREDWAEIRLSPRIPLVGIRVTRRDRIEVVVAKVDVPVKDIFLKVAYVGELARAYAGDRLLAETEGTGEAWRFSILEFLEGGGRELRFEFERRDGRLISAKVEPVVEKRLKVRLGLPAVH